MKTKIKYIAITLTIIALATAVIFVACKKMESSETNDNIQKFIQIVHKGAVVHNEGLEYVYDELIKTKSTEDFQSISESATFNFIQSHPFFQADVDYALSNAKRMFERLEKRQKTRESNRLWHDEDDDLLSKSQKDWLTLINNAIDDANDAEQMLVNLENIKKLVLKQGNLDDQYIATIAIEIGKESLKYWYDNGDKWEEISPESLRNRGWFSWKSVGKNDIAYGIAGAVVGGAGAAITGAGIVAGFVGGAIAGAVTGSLGSALLQIMDHWW